MRPANECLNVFVLNQSTSSHGLRREDVHEIGVRIGGCSQQHTQTNLLDRITLKLEPRYYKIVDPS